MVLHPLEMLAAIQANDHARKRMALGRLSRSMRGGNAGECILCGIEGLLIDDCRMCLGGVVLRKLTSVSDPLFLDMIVDVCFLQQ